MKKILTLAFLLSYYSSTWGQAGRPNSFFNGGSVNTPFDPSGALAEDLVIQSDGKIVAAGLAYNGGIAHFALAKYKNNGSLDHTFGVNGKVTTLINAGSWAHAVAIQADGKIIAAGYAENNSSQDFALVRYHPNGLLDHSFGVKGIVTTDFADYPDEIYDIAIQPDGKIVAGGRTFNGVNHDFALVRYLSDGQIDMSFAGGKIILEVGPGNDFAQSIQLQTDGKIIIAGTAFNGLNNNMALLRLTEQGSPDLSFGLNGKVFTAIGTNESFGFDLALQPDGKILFTGHTYNVLPYRIDVALVRYNPSGATDPTFGINGIVITDIANANDDGIGVVVQNDGKIVVAGHSTNEGFKDFLLLRYLSNGVLDAGFGSGGITLAPIGNYDDIAYAVKLSGLNIYVSGISNSTPSGVPGQFAIAAFLNDAVPLPVKIIAFTAEKESDFVSLKWITENEIQLQSFIVERSPDGKNFNQLLEVASSTDATASKMYHAKDRQPHASINYYRLKNINIDGSFAYSRIIALRNKSYTHLQVFPNPAISNVQVQLPAGFSGKMEIEILEISGRVILKNRVELTGNATSTSFDFSSLPKGVYLLRAVSEEVVFTQKVMKL